MDERRAVPGGGRVAGRASAWTLLPAGAAWLAARAAGSAPAARPAGRSVEKAAVAVVAPGPGLVGGQESQATLLCALLLDSGCEVRRIAVNPRLPRPLGWTRRVPGLRTAVNAAVYLAALRRLRGSAVAHVFAASYWSFLLGPVPALAAARALGVRTVLHYHSGEAEDHLARWGWLVHPWLRAADVIVVPSRYLHAVFARHGHAAHVVPNIVDVERFRFRDRRPLRPRFLSARNLEAHYRVDQTLCAFALVRERHPDATLLVAGSGRREGELRRLARGLGDAGIRFLGSVPPERMPEIHDACDILLNSSVVDNQPVSVLEAFAAGLPVISTTAGDLRHMVLHDSTGVAVPATDPGAMARAACDLLADPERARRLARTARRLAEGHRADAVAEAWLRLYREVTE